MRPKIGTLALFLSATLARLFFRHTLAPISVS
jgi:hypothetical protein